MDELKFVAPDTLLPAEYNPRKITNEEREQLKTSVEKFGFVEPVIVNTNPDREGIIVGGHRRVETAIELEIENIPVIEVNLTEGEERELNVRLNRNTGQWDFNLLLENFETEELIEWGFEESEITFPSSEDVLPSVPDEIRLEGFIEMTFKLHVEQEDLVRGAIGRAIQDGHGQSAINEDEPGNALSHICGLYLKSLKSK